MPLAPSAIAQLFKLSKKLLGLEDVFFTGMALAIPFFLIISLNIFSLTSSDSKIFVTSTNSIGFLKSGLSVPYFSRDSL